ncbi:MAG: hypothetical protein L6R48_15155 [Planctomycetes bacterium]|nr:hypothetical protein [Planctomycetota bacterium]
MSSEDRLAALERLQGVLIESLGLWAAEDPDLSRLAVLAADAEAILAGLAALPERPGTAAEVARAAAEAERLRRAVAENCSERDGALRRAWAEEQRREAAVRGAYQPEPAPGDAKFFDGRS